MIGGIITVKDHEKTGSYCGLLEDYTASIVDVLSSTKLKVDPPFSQTIDSPNYLGEIAISVPPTHNDGEAGRGAPLVVNMEKINGTTFIGTVTDPTSSVADDGKFDLFVFDA